MCIRDRTCAVVNDDYIDVDDDKHLPVERISVLVTADYYDEEMITDLIVTDINWPMENWPYQMSTVIMN